MGRVSENGIIPYDLGAGMFCEECHRPKSFRLWPGTRTGCKTCDEVVTRHRCQQRPAVDDLGLGESWTCPDCGTTWTCAEKEDWCGECGQATGTRKGWDSVPGDRIATAPRFDPQPFTPFRNLFPRSAARYDPPGPFGECYQMASGPMVHVRPGCRCKA